MDWPIFFKTNLKIGNLSSSVAICTLWTKKDQIYSELPEEKYAVCGNLYSVQGVNYIIKNILANPKIRYIVLCGKNLSKSKEALINLIKNGIDENRKIIDSEAYVASNLDLELLNKFRRNVILIDMSGKENEIGEKIDELRDLPPFSEPVVVEEDTTTSINLPKKIISPTIRAKTIGEGWLKLLNFIMNFGEEKPSEYDLKQREILGLTMVIEGQEEEVSPWFGFSQEDVDDYCKKFLSPEKTKEVHYTYGERLFSHPIEITGGEITKTFNQVEKAIEHLKKVPYTRRAYASTYNVKLDPNSKEPPCISQVSWNIKDGKLYQITTIRSNDMFKAWPLNAFGLRALHKLVAEKVGIERGSMTIISLSAHIYESDWNDCKTILDEHFKGGSVKFETDVNGYFLIYLENGEIVAQHILPGGLKTDFVFRSKSAIELYRRFLHEGLISKMDHAAYIGKELGRAEMCLKQGKEFEQDKA